MITVFNLAVFLFKVQDIYPTGLHVFYCSILAISATLLLLLYYSYSSCVYISYRMKPLGITVVLGLVVGALAQLSVPQPHCDSPEVEEAALVAQDYLNAQHTHGYKYALNRIEDIKIYPNVSQQV